MVITLSKIPKAKSDGGWKEMQAPLKIASILRRNAVNYIKKYLNDTVEKKAQLTEENP